MNNELAPIDEHKRRARRRPLLSVERRERCVEMRMAGMSYAAIGTVLGIDRSAAQRHVAAAIRERKINAGEAMALFELQRLEQLHDRCQAILDEKCPLVQGGAVVYDTVEDEDGNPVIDPRTGKTALVKLQDRSIALAAIAQLTRISAEIRKLKGVDAPKRIETLNAPTAPLTDADPERIARAVAIGIRRARGLPDSDEVVDAQSVEPQTDKNTPILLYPR